MTAIAVMAVGAYQSTNKSPATAMATRVDATQQQLQWLEQ
jgi:hypothetical protein